MKLVWSSDFRRSGLPDMRAHQDRLKSELQTIFGDESSGVLVADLTRGAGRFNITQGAIGTATGIVTFLSMLVAGLIVKYADYHTERW